MCFHESHILIKMRMDSEFLFSWNGKGISLCDCAEGMLSKCDPLETVKMKTLIQSCIVSLTLMLLLVTLHESSFMIRGGLSHIVTSSFLCAFPDVANLFSCQRR
jgi:hypothetical protein